MSRNRKNHSLEEKVAILSDHVRERGSTPCGYVQSNSELAHFQHGKFHLPLSQDIIRCITFLPRNASQCADHILSFFNLLRTELAFCAGCLNLHEQLTRKGELLSFSVPVPSSERPHFFRDSMMSVFP